jgi:hypothetical protein
MIDIGFLNFSIGLYSNIYSIYINIVYVDKLYNKKSMFAANDNHERGKKNYPQ